MKEYIYTDMETLFETFEGYKVLETCICDMRSYNEAVLMVFANGWYNIDIYTMDDYKGEEKLLSSNNYYGRKPIITKKLSKVNYIRYVITLLGETKITYVFLSKAGTLKKRHLILNR